MDVNVTGNVHRSTDGAATIRVASDLRFFLHRRHRHPPVRTTLDGTSSLGHLVESLGIPLTEVAPIVVNGSPQENAYRPRDGDVVDVEPIPRPQRVHVHRFLLDVHLGTLARRLRLLGLDTAYRNQADDDELVQQARDEGRVLLTRDRGLLRRRALPIGAYVRGDRPSDQVRDVLDRFAPPLHPWSRCPACNGILKRADVADVSALLQPGTLRSYTEFSQCDRCQAVYWRGAHAGRLDEVVGQALGRD